MAKYYECAIRYDKTGEDGKVKRVTERYLTDALSLTESEARVTEKMQPYISGEFYATSAKETKIAETTGDVTCGKFFLAKVAFITIDEKTAKEKRTISQVLVGAENFDEAYKAFNEYMRDTLADYTLVSLAETAYMDLF
ncbi:MAG: DUF4494 domain-containing protein [Muribaculaceae bacterium]|nr:DUF4494 domain-containing protein [Muribaculaceae bacterium]